MELITHLKESGTLRVVSSLALHSAKMSLFPSMMLIAVIYQYDYFDKDAEMKMTMMVIIVTMMLLNMRR